MAAHISVLFSLNDGFGKNMQPRRRPSAGAQQKQPAKPPQQQANKEAKDSNKPSRPALPRATTTNPFLPTYQPDSGTAAIVSSSSVRPLHNSATSSPVHHRLDTPVMENKASTAESSPSTAGGGSFRDNISLSGLSSGFWSIKRRFSQEQVNEAEKQHDEPPTDGATDAAAAAGSRGAPPPAGYAAQQQQQQQAGTFSIAGITNKVSSTISAPTSPSRHERTLSAQQHNNESASMVEQVHGLTKNLFQAATQRAYSKDKCKCLMVIDNQLVDWSKYFRGKKVLGEYDIRVEQAELSEITLVAHSESGCVLELNIVRNAQRQQRTVEPDFVLLRECVRTAAADHSALLLGLMYGAVPCLNSLNSVYNFLHKPWVFAHLLAIQRRLGKDKFPLIDQSYFPSHSHVSSATTYPCVVKVGSEPGGAGKMRVNSEQELADLVSVLGTCRQYCTVEPFVNAKYDIHIQKIGQSYKAFMRKSIGDNWKSNTGASMLEQVALADRYKMWIDEVSQLFGGLDMCGIQLVVAQDGQERLIKASGSSLTLLGETQEEDRRLIAELTLQKMSYIIGLRRSNTQTVDIKQPPSDVPQQQPQQPQQQASKAVTNTNYIKHESPMPNRALQNGGPHGGKLPPPRPRGPLPATDLANCDMSIDVADPNVPAGEDTMGNLKKTFAGIFGEM